MDSISLKNGLSIRTVISIILIFIILLISLFYLNILNYEKILQESLSERAKAKVFSLEASFGSLNDLKNSQKVNSIIQKNMLLDPDLAHIHIALFEEGALKIIGSNHPADIGESPNYENLESFNNEETISKEDYNEQGIPILKVVSPLHIAQETIGTIEVQYTLEKLNQEIRKNLINFLSIFVTLSLVFFLIIFFLLNKISKSLNNLTENIEEISKGKVDVELPRSNLFEIRNLITSLNRVLASLKLAIMRTGIKKEELGLGKALQKKEEALKKSERKFQQIVEHSDQLFYIHNTNNILTYISPQSKIIFGYDPQEMMVNWKDLTTNNPINKQAIKITENALKTGKKQSPYLLEIKTKNGQKKIVKINESPLKDEKGVVIGIIGAVTDISEQRTKERLTEKYLELSQIMMVQLNKEGKIAMINKRGAEILGFADPSELIGKYWFTNFVSKEKQKEIEGIFKKIIKGKEGTAEYYQNEIIDKNKKVKLLEFHNTVLKDSSGQIIGTLSSGREIMKSNKKEGFLKRIFSKKDDFSLRIPEKEFEKPIAKPALKKEVPEKIIPKKTYVPEKKTMETVVNRAAEKAKSAITPLKPTPNKQEILDKIKKASENTSSTSEVKKPIEKKVPEKETDINKKYFLKK